MGYKTVGERRESRPWGVGGNLEFAESLVWWVWCKGFKYKPSFNVLRNFGRLLLLSSFCMWGNWVTVGIKFIEPVSGGIKLSVTFQEPVVLIHPCCLLKHQKPLYHVTSAFTELLSTYTHEHHVLAFPRSIKIQSTLFHNVHSARTQMIFQFKYNSGKRKARHSVC